MNGFAKSLVCSAVVAFASALVCALVFAPGAVAAPDDMIPGVTLPASPVLDQLTLGLDEQDVYSVYLEAGQRLCATATIDPGAEVELLLDGPTATYPSEDLLASAAGPGGLGFTATASGTYYLTVCLTAGAGGSTQLVHKIIEPAANDNLPGEPLGDSILGDGSGWPENPADVYWIDLDAGELVSVLATSAPGTALTDMMILGPETTDINVDTPVAWADWLSESESAVYYRTQSAGRYYVVFMTRGGYAAQVSRVSWAPDDEIPGVAIPASPFAVSGHVYGDTDIYEVELSQGKAFAAETVGPWGVAALDLLAKDPSTGEVTVLAWGDPGLSYVPTESGTYYLSVRNTAQQADYEIAWSADGTTDDVLPGIPRTAPFTESLSAWGDQIDVTAIPLERGQRVVFSYVPTDGDLVADVRLLAPAASDVGDPASCLTEVTYASQPATRAYTADETGVHSLAVVALSGEGSYGLDWTVLSEPDDQIPGVPLPDGTASLDPPFDEEDVYAVTLTAGQHFAAVTTRTAGEGSVGLNLFSPSATSIHDTEAWCAGGYPDAEGVAVLGYTPSESGTYYLVATADGSCEYEIGTPPSGSPDDEVPGVPLAPSVQVGSLDWVTDPDDVYRIELAKGDRLWWRASEIGDGSVPWTRLLGAETTRVASGIALLSSSINGTETIVAPADGTYYLAASYGQGEYSISWQKTVAGADDDIPGVPLPPESVGGTLSATEDPDDVYSVWLDEGDRLAMSLEDSATYWWGGPSMEVYGPSASTVASCSPESDLSGGSYTAVTSGTHYVRVKSDGYSGPYRLTWTGGAPTTDDSLPGLQLPASPVIGTLAPPFDAHDYYSLPLEAGEVLDATLTAAPGPVSLGPVGIVGRVWRDGSWVRTAGSASVSTTAAVLHFVAPSTGTYSFEPLEPTGAAFAYSMEWSTSAGPEPYDDQVPGPRLPMGASTASWEGAHAVTPRQPDVYSAPLERGDTLAVACPQAQSMRLLPTGAASIAATPSATGSHELVFRAPSSGTYQLVVAGSTSTSEQDTYLLAARVVRPSAYSDVPGIPLPSPEATIAVAPGEVATDRVFAVGLTAGEFFVGNLSATDSARADVAMYAPGTESVYETQAVATWTRRSDGRILFRAEKTGTHYLRVTPSGDGVWGVSWLTHTSEADDRIPGVALAGASVTSTVDADYDPVDIYRIELNGKSLLHLSGTVPSMSDCTLAVYGPDIASIEATAPLAYSDSWLNSIDFEAPTDGTYYVVQRAATGGGEYELTWSVTAPPAPPLPPEVVGLDPVGGSKVAGAQQRLRAAVAHGTTPLSIHFETSDDSGGSWQDLSDAVPEGRLYEYTYWSTLWDTTALPDGPVLVRAVASDGDGRSDEGTPTALMVDNTAPSRPFGVSAGDGRSVRVEWRQAATADLDHFTVWRWAEGAEEIAVANTAEQSWVDRDVDPGVRYRYRVQAVDDVGNTSAFSEPAVADVDPDGVVPVAEAGKPQRVYAGSTVVLDGSASSDDRGIRSYHWDFGDGESGEDAVAAHSYAQAGTYTAWLTVTDRGGNTASGSTTVTVRPVDPNGPATLVVSADDSASGRGIPGAMVLVETEGGDRLLGTADTRGHATFTLDAGYVSVYVYDDGHLPGVSGTDLVGGETSTLGIALESGEVFDAEVTYERMTPLEMIQAGIDVNDPANQWTYSFFALWGTKGGPSVVVSGPSEGTVCAGHWEGGGATGVGYGSGAWVDFVGGVPTASYVLVAGRSSWLKEFFDVSLNVRNLVKDPAFRMAGTTASLVATDGLTLAPKLGDRQQACEVDLGDIGAEESRTVSWQLRGDKEGSYPLAANVSSTLMPFEREITRPFRAKDPIRVYGRNAIVTSLDVPEKVEKGRPFTVNYSMQNKSPVPVHNLKAELTAVEGAELVGGAWTQYFGDVEPEATVVASWTFIAEATGELLAKENEGDISTYVRRSDVSGDEIVVPFLPEDESSPASVELGGTVLRYYRVVERGYNLDVPASIKGVPAIEGTATLSVFHGAGASRTETVTLQTDVTWPSGVFAVPLRDPGAAGDTFDVRIVDMTMDGKAVDASACAGFSGRVRERSGAESTWSYGENSIVGATVTGVDLESTGAYSAAYTLRPNNSVRTDIDSTLGIGAGLSVPGSSSFGFQTPAVSGEIAATTGLKIGRSFTTGTSSEFTSPSTDGREGMALAANICDMLKLSQMGSGPQRLGTPVLTALGGAFGAVSDARDFQSRRMNGAGVWAKAEARVGGSYGFGPKVNGDVAGAQVNAINMPSSYSIECQLAEYPSGPDADPGTGELGFRLLDKSASSASALSIKAKDPWRSLDESIGLSSDLSGATQIEGVFDASVAQSPPLSILDAAGKLNRIEVTLDDPKANRQYVFVTTGDTLRKIISDNSKDGSALDEATLVRAVQGSVVSAGAGDAGRPQWTGIAGPAAEKVVEYATESRVISGPDSRQYAVPWGIQGDIAKIAGLNLGFEQTFLQRARSLESRGLVKGKVLYPVETHSEPPSQPNLEELWQSMSTALGNALADSGDTIRNRYSEVVGGPGAFIEQHPPSFGPAALAGTSASAVTRDAGALAPGAGTITLDIPAGALSAPTTVTVDSYAASMTAEAYAPGGQPISAGVALLDAMHAVTPLDLSMPATVSVGWSAASAAGIDPDAIDLWRFDDELGRWVALGAKVEGSRATVVTTRFGTFAAGADVSGPSIAISSPQNGATLAIARPWLFFTAMDPTSKLDTDTVTAQVDGVDVPVAFDASLQCFAAQLPVLGNGAHDLMVSADDARGNHGTSTSTFAIDLVAPGAPGNVAVAVDGEAAHVTWTLSDDTGAAYRIWRRAAEQTEAVCIATCPDGSYDDYAVPGGVDCQYSVSAIDAAGNESARVSANSLHVVRTPAFGIRAAKAGASVSIEASLTGVGGLPLQGEEYRLESSTNGANWSRIATVTQDASAYTTSVPLPDRTTTYRVVYAGCPGYAGKSASAVVNVEVVTPPTPPTPPAPAPISVSAGTPGVSGKATAKKGTSLKGTIAPSHAARVTLEVQVYSKRKYRSYKRYGVSTTAAGTWAYKAKLKKGTYRVRVVAPAEGLYLPATSGWRKVVVK